MAEQMSDAQLLGLTAAAVGGVTALATGADAGTTADPDRVAGG